MDPGRDELRRQAAALILEASGVTGALTDEEARPLMAWALSQGEAAAEALWASPAAGEARSMLTEAIAPVRRAMRALSRLAGKRSDLSPSEMVEELEAIRASAEALPLPAGKAMTDTALAELAAWQSRLDTRAFVRAVLFLLNPEPAGEPSAD